MTSATAATASSSFSEERARNLEVEAHYLTQALSKLSQRSPEYEFLSRKLEAAEGELESLKSGAAAAASTAPVVPYRDFTDSEGITSARAPPPAATTPRIDIGRDGPDLDGGGSPADLADQTGDEYCGVGAGGRGDESDGDRTPFYDYDDNSYAPALNRNSGEGDGGGGGRGLVSLDLKGRKPRRLSPREVMLLVTLVTFVIALALVPLGRRGDGTDNEGSGAQAALPRDDLDDFVGPCATFRLHLVPDQFGNETSWKLLRYEGVEEIAALHEAEESQGTVVLSGGPYSYREEFFHEDVRLDHYEMVHAKTCLPKGSYAFILYDARGDGLCCDYGTGEYGMKLSGKREIRPLSPGKFAGERQVTPFEVGRDDIDILSASGSSSLSTEDSGATNDDRPNPLLDTVGDVPDEPCASFSMHLIPDQFGNETSWKIWRHDGVTMSQVMETRKFQEGAVVLSGGPYEYKKDFDKSSTGSHYDMIQATTCLPIGVYTFILYDVKGDGICCDYGRGEYGIDLSKGRIVRPLSSGKFKGEGEVTPFEVNGEDINIVPPHSPRTVDGIANNDVVGDDVNGGRTSGDDPSSLSFSGADSVGQKGPCASFSMHLVPDQFGNETSWEVLRKRSERTYVPTYTPTASPARGHTGNTRSNGRLLREAKVTNMPGEIQAMPSQKCILEERRFIKDTQERRKHWLLVLSGGPYSYKASFDKEGASTGSHYNAIIAEACLPVGSYIFVIYDRGMDGICCDYGRGEYGINLSRGRVVRPLSSGAFLGASQETPFKVFEEDIDVDPDSSPSTTDAAVDSAIPAGEGSDVVGSEIPAEQQGSSSSSMLGDSSEVSSGVSQVVHQAETNANPLSSLQQPLTSTNTLSSLVTLPGDGTKTGQGKSYGILFDVESSNSLVIAGLDMYLDTVLTVHCEVWAKVGSWQDVLGADPDYSAGFRQVSRGSVAAKGPSEFTKIALQDFQEVEIQGGQRHSFWLTLSDDDLIYERYEGEGISRHEMETIVQADTGTIKVYYGAAIQAYDIAGADPETDFWMNAGFMGRLWYRERPA